MDDQRQLGVVDGLHHLVDGFHREGRLAFPVLLTGRAAGQVRRGEVGGATLRRAVDGDLDAAELEPVVVLHEGLHGIAPHHVFELGDEGIGDDVDEEFPFLRAALEDLEIGDVGGAFVGGGHAGGGEDLLTFDQGGDLRVGRGLGQLGEDRQEGGLHQQAFGLVAAGLSNNHAAGRGRGVGADVVFLHRQRIQHRAVKRDVADHHRIVREMGIEIGGGELAAFRVDAVIVAVAHDDLPLGDVLLGDELLDRFNDAFLGRTRAERGGVAVRLAGDAERVDEVAVAVDEGRHEVLAAEVVEGGVRLFELERFFLRSGENDLAVLDGEGLDVGGLLAGHGEDGAVVEDGVGGRRGGGIRGGGLLAAEEDGGGDAGGGDREQGDGFRFHGSFRDWRVGFDLRAWCPTPECP